MCAASHLSLGGNGQDIQMVDIKLVTHRMLHNVCISLCETCLSATQETAEFWLDRLYNVKYTLRSFLPRIYSITNTKH